MDDHTDEEKPTDDDYRRALRLSRKYIYGGAEPYAPAVTGFARMLAAHRRELLREVASQAMDLIKRVETP